MSTVTSRESATITFNPSAAGQPFILGAARLSLAASALFLVLLAALHIVKPELDPSWRMVSEYEVGRYGWMMSLAFLSLVVSCVAVCIAIRPAVQTIGGYVGLAFLLATAVGMAIAAIFIADPITASKDALTTHGTLHGLGAFVGLPSMPIAATLISRSLARNRTWSSTRRVLFVTAGLTWISLVALGLSVAIMLPQHSGSFGPDVLIGWQNRFIVVANSGWLIAVALHAARLSRQSA